MNKIKDHIAGEGLSTLIIDREDIRREGHAHSFYRIKGFDTSDNPSAESAKGYRSSFSSLPLVFQTAPPVDGVANGVTIEALLAVCADRLRQFQEGPFASPHNQQALGDIEQALSTLHERTRERNSK